MDTLRSAINLVKKDCYFASITLKDAYYSVAVHPSDRKYLQFFWEEELFQFTSLPMGLSSAHRIFTKIMKPVFSHLRKLGHSIIAYIDDCLLQGDTCLRNVDQTVEILDSLGLTIYPSKSVFQPSKQIVFLGFILDSEKMTASLTQEKANDVIHCCSNLMKKHEVCICDFAQVIGKLVACEPAVQHAPLFTKSLEHDKEYYLKIVKGDYNAKMIISNSSKQQLNWWIDNVLTSFKPISREPPIISLETDSSKVGGEGHVKGDKTKKTGVHWSYSEKQNNINYLELQAAFLTLQCFCSTLHNCNIQLFLDNTVAVAFLSYMGGKSHLRHELTRKIWLWCIDRNIWLAVNHVPGAKNVIADELSRKLSMDTEWSLDYHVFPEICSMFGKPSIDLFASRLNDKLLKYVSFLPGPTACAIDSFNMNLDCNILYYSFPPFSCIGRLLQKMEIDRAEMILVAPVEPTTLVHENSSRSNHSSSNKTNFVLSNGARRKPTH